MFLSPLLHSPLSFSFSSWQVGQDFRQEFHLLRGFCHLPLRLSTNWRKILSSSALSLSLSLSSNARRGGGEKKRAANVFSPPLLLPARFSLSVCFLQRPWLSGCTSSARSPSSSSFSPAEVEGKRAPPSTSYSCLTPPSTPAWNEWDEEIGRGGEKERGAV